MSNYEIRQCEGFSHEKWCVYVNAACDRSLGEFNSKEEAEVVVCQLILREKTLAIDTLAKFGISIPADGIVVAVIEPSEDVGYGVSQKYGRDVYALHTGKAFADVMLQDTITVKYLNGEANVLIQRENERGGNER